jgi:HD-like signal output (HDOD) protein/ActR/RegA family two-component response regulator
VDKRILFVDDEAKVLDGFRRILRPMRHEWDVQFTAGGPEALEIMERQAFDIVISDVRMPGMTGIEFLTEVRRRHPEVIRIVLTGQADEGLAARSIGVVHQYLSKPCEADTIVGTVVRTLGLRALLSDEKLKVLISQLGALPSLPSLYLEIVDELRSPDASIRRIGEIVSKDLAMTAKILQLVNSAFFGIRRRISNPMDATAYLGLETIHSLVLSIQAFSQFEGQESRGVSVEKLWSHSMRAAIFARILARIEGLGKTTADESFTAGLLHDLGRLVLACKLTSAYSEMLGRQSGGEADLCAAERAAFGASHAEVGAYLLGLWGLPDTIVEATAYHHHPAELPCRATSLLTCVHVADALEAETSGESGDAHPAEVDSRYLEEIGKGEALDSWRAACARQCDQGAAS